MPTTRDITAELGAEIIVHLARLAQSCGESGLTAAQWSALRFFHRANRLSRTPSAFSAFHATTRGTASQTVKSLVAAGLLERHRNEDDGRSWRFELTAAGQQTLRRDPMAALVRVLRALDPAERGALVATLQSVTGALSDLRSSPMFGTCGDCKHYDPSDDDAFCRCRMAVVDCDDSGALCIEFLPRKAAGDRRAAVGK